MNKIRLETSSEGLAEQVVDYDSDFILASGDKISTIKELKETIENMDDDVFRSHVNLDKNDFAMWIEHVFSNGDLAQSLRMTHDKAFTLKILEYYLNTQNEDQKALDRKKIQTEATKEDKSSESSGENAAISGNKENKDTGVLPKKDSFEVHKADDNEIVSSSNTMDSEKLVNTDEQSTEQDKQSTKILSDALDPKQLLKQEDGKQENEIHENKNPSDEKTHKRKDQDEQPEEQNREILVNIDASDVQVSKTLHYDPIYLPQPRTPIIASIKNLFKKIKTRINKSEKREETKKDNKKEKDSAKEKKQESNGLTKTKISTTQKGTERNKPEKEEEPLLLHEPQFTTTGVPGFDEMITKGIPEGSSVLLCGGAGTGKTTFSLNILNNAAQKKEKCLYLTFEEEPARLRAHMKNYGWDPIKLEKEGYLKIKKMDPFEISRSVEALLAKASGELIIELDEAEGILPRDFKPDKIVLDSLSAVAAAFVGRDDGYRIYVEQLFNVFKNIGATSFLISEVEENANKYTRTGVEEFLADAVIVFYNLRQKNVRVNAVEIIKIRGTSFQKKIVPFKIQAGHGITVFPKEDPFFE